MNDAPPFAADFAGPEPRWHWRNCRSIGLGVSLWPLDWHWGVQRTEDVYGGEFNVAVGPLHLQLSYSIGNASLTPWALCEVEAYDRAMDFERSVDQGGEDRG